jgi:hypothetical protein
MEITLEELTSALIRVGFFFPSQRNEAEVTAKDIFLYIENPDKNYPNGEWKP